MKYAIPLLGAAVLAVGLAFPARAAVEEQSTSLVSSTPYLFSYRHQRHMVVTADGRYHLLANLGTQGGAQASLYLLSSHDGVNWVQQRHLGYTGYDAVSDSGLTGNTLTSVFQDNQGFIRYATATYDPDTQSWSSFTVSKLPRASADIRAVNPSFAVDANGNTWVAYVEEDTRVGVETARIVVYRRAAGKTNWVAAGYLQPFSDVGPYETIYRAKRSARLVSFPGGIGMVYTVGKDIFWAERQLKGGATMAWNSSTMFLSGSEDNDPMSSHFSAVTDATGNVFVTFTDAGNLYFTRRDAATRQWPGQPRMLISADQYPGIQPTYSQISWLGGDQLLLASNFQDNIRVWKGSTGATPGFTCLLQATHTVRDANAYYRDARLEMPALPAPNAAVPLLQQWQEFNPDLPPPEKAGTKPLQYANGLTFSPSSAPNCD